jgi:hypothetical protein
VANVIRVGVEGATDIAKDMRAAAEGFDTPLHDVLDHAGQLVADTAKQFMRYRPEGAWKDSSGARYGHIRDYYAHRTNETSASVYTSHPAGPVWEWGGHIDPGAGGGEHFVKRDLKARAHARQKIRQAGGRQGFEIPRLEPVGKAGRASAEDIHRDFEDTVDRYLREHNL